MANELSNFLGQLAGRRKPKDQDEAPAGRPRLVADHRPDMLYAIGDVHGCLDLLLALETEIVRDAAAHEGEKWLVYLGDYVDRGPKSAQVLDHLLAPAPDGFRRICLSGNHEAAMLTAIRDPAFAPRWLAYGAVETLQSYGMGHNQIEALVNRGRGSEHLLETYVPQEHVRFLSGLAVSLTLPGLCFVHAGIRPGIALELQAEEDLMWIRSEFLEHEGDYGALVVHGHTPAEQPYLSVTRIGIDTGAFATGVLTAVRITLDGEARIMQVKGRPG